MTTISNELNQYWDESILTQGMEFRAQKSVLEQHSLASEHESEFRVPYGVDGFVGWQLMNEIKRRRERAIITVGLKWPPSDDPYEPADDPHHSYYLG